MSGGSFCYLFSKGREALTSPCLLEMADTLDSWAEAGLDVKPEAERTRAIVDAMDVLERAVEELSEAWRAVEWAQSCDWSDERAVEHIRGQR